MVTMQEVAHHAGVSTMTVSNVINGRPNVRDATREKVLAAIEALGYHVNTAARSLRQGRSGVIGLAVPQIDRPYFGHLASLLVTEAARAGYDLVIEETREARENELDAIRHSRLRSYDGLIISTNGLTEADMALFRGDFPVVMLGERTYRSPVDHVEMANTEGGALAVTHLVDRGCRRIAMLGGRIDGEDRDVTTARCDGYRSGLEAAGSAFDPALVRQAPYTPEGGYAAAQDLVARKLLFDGLFCATDLVALGAVRALHEQGIRVPQDVLVVGFDDIPLLSYVTPSLSTIAPDHTGMAAAALRLLSGRIDGTRDDDDYRTVVGDVRLVVRESSTRL